jgi:hypothetical protein
MSGFITASDAYFESCSSGLWGWDLRITMTALFSLLSAIFNHDSVACFWWLLCLSYSGLSGRDDKCAHILVLPRVFHVAL